MSFPSRFVTIESFTPPFIRLHTLQCQQDWEIQDAAFSQSHYQVSATSCSLGWYETACVPTVIQAFRLLFACWQYSSLCTPSHFAAILTLPYSLFPSSHLALLCAPPTRIPCTPNEMMFVSVRLLFQLTRRRCMRPRLTLDPSAPVEMRA